MGSVRPDGRQLDAAVAGLGAARRPASWAARGPSASARLQFSPWVVRTRLPVLFLLFFNFYMYVFSHFFQSYPPPTFFN